MIAKSYIIALAAMLLVFSISGCTAVQRISDPGQGEVGYLRLDVEPADTRIYIDADYQGRVDGWAAQTVLLKPGMRQVELRADGYMTRRFDLEVEAGAQSVLKVLMEPNLERLDGDSPEETGEPKSPVEKLRSLRTGN